MSKSNSALKKIKPESNLKNQLKLALEQLNLLQTEVNQITQSMQDKVETLEALTSFSSILNSTLDPADVRERALEATCKLLKCETASLFLVDTRKGDLYFETALGETGKSLKKSIRIAINDRSIAGYVAMTGEVLLLNDVQKDPRFFKRATAKSSFVARNMICVPLFSKGLVSGVLQAINKIPSIPKKESHYAWPEFVHDDRKLLENLAHQVAIAVENSKLYTSIKNNFYETIEALAEAIEKKDRYTGGHTKRVVFYALAIADCMGLSPEELERIRFGAVLHDIGKIGIEDKILKKDAPLDNEEWEVMQTHPEIGYQIMNRVEGLKDIVSAMRFHHERWDGKGYPLGLKGLEIPLVARVISVADTYDAMVSTRPYRKGLAPQIAFDEISKHRGTQFCPETVDAFVKAFQSGKMGRGSG